MNTPSTSNVATRLNRWVVRAAPAGGIPQQRNAGLVPARSRLCRSVLLSLAGCSFLALSSCGMSQGAMLYMLGVGQGKKMKASFHLTQGPLLILVDDPQQRVDWPMAKRYLFDRLAQELLEHKAATKIVPLETIAHLRQAKPNFDSRGCREVGKMAGADQVLWIEVQDFHASEQIENALNAAFFSVTLKVIDANANDRTHVRLWPVAPQGQLLTITLSGSEVSMAKTKNAISRKLATKLAMQAAKFFYDFRLGDFEREP